MKKTRKAAAQPESRPELINFVCRYDLKFNHARVYDDRKKKMKAGYRKHKNQQTLCDENKSAAFFVAPFITHHLKALASFS
jgi:hypothetical protein